MDPRSTRPHHHARGIAVILLLFIFALVFVLVSPLSSSDGPTVSNVKYSGELGDDILWNINEEGVLTISGTGVMPNVQWNTPWYDYRGEIRAVVIGEGVQSISNGLLEGCESLTEIQISSTVQDVGDLGRYNHPLLLSITVSNDNDAYTSVNGVLFNKTRTTLIKYPAAKNGDYYTIGTSVTAIGEGAFYGCKSLREITLPNGLQTIGELAFCGCTSLIRVDIPDSLVSLGRQSFYECKSLLSVVIPNGVTRIDGTFYNCTSLISVTIGSSVQEIEYYSFPTDGRLYEIINLSSLALEAGSSDYGSAAVAVKSVVSSPDDATLRYDDRGFYYGRANDQSYLVAYTGNEHVLALPSDFDGYQYIIGPNAFYNNKDLISLDVGDNVTAIEWNALAWCDNLASLTIGESVTRIENSGNMHRLYEIIDLSNLNIEIGQLSYNGSISYYADVILSSREESTLVITDDGFVFGKPTDDYYLICYVGDEVDLVLPADIDGHQYRIREFALSNMKLHTLEMGDGVTGANVNAFSFLQVETVTIGSSYRDPTFGENIVKSDKLTAYIVDEDNTMYSSVDGILYSKDGTILVIYPGGRQNEDFTVPENVTDVYYFGGNKYLKRVVVHDGVSMWLETFSGCSSLSDVRLPSDMTAIPFGMFRHCISLEHIEIPDTVTSIGDQAFYDTGIKGIELHYGLTSIGSYAFAESELTSIDIPYSVTTIGNYAFQATKIESLFIPDSVTYLGSYNFNLCYGLHEF